jgi:hypothetical protein
MVKRNGTTFVDTSTGNAEFDAKIEKLMAFMSQPKEKAQSAAQLIARAMAERKGEDWASLSGAEKAARTTKVKAAPGKRVGTPSAPAWVGTVRHQPA